MMNINKHIGADVSIIHINSKSLTYRLFIDANTFGKIEIWSHAIDLLNIIGSKDTFCV